MPRVLPSLALLLIGQILIGNATLVCPAAHAGEGWVHDFEKAKEQARKEKKDLLIDFTGSDWCSWCIKLRREVFDQPEFKKAAPTNFVLVELDFPRRTQLEKSLREQNETLKTAFQIRGYPTVMLTDAEGRPYAKTGYRPGGAEEYLAHLDAERAKRVERDKLFERARKVEGVEGAKLLDRALSLIERSQVPLVGYESVYAEIVRLDAENEAGLRAKYELRAGIQQLERLSAKRDFVAVIKTADEILKGTLTEENRQRVLFYKAFAHYNEKRYDEAIVVLEASIAAAPKSTQAASIERALEQVKAQSKKAGPGAGTKGS